ncbi:MAG TPA: acetyl-CoA carboxylase carboxyltransferase subunit alpha, partial [Terriglobales bacterium]|nr:acetyl-CoA carboxylase carboxyltransferase subunit alpha [Terriglobales bacterium]
MRRAKIKRAGKSDPSAENVSNDGAKRNATESADINAVAGTDFMLSIVEAHHTRKSGNIIKMDAGLKAQQELEKIEEQITRLEALEGQNGETLRQIQQLHGRVSDLRREISSHLNAWERTELARHPQRPYTLDYVERIFTDWSEIHGDRGFRDDPAIVCGMARFHGEEVIVIGQQKARDAKQRVYRNFGMPHPEGYRKALRVMKIAEKFKRPILTFVDTDGAYPGLHAEERGQGEAIARNLLEMARLEVPIIATVIGVGGSGGALAIAVADRVLMMENSVYSVISPEGCASIMWRDASKKDLAAEAMKITAKDLNELGCIDGIIPEP